MVDKDALGRPATFLLPSLKLKQRDAGGRTVEDRVETFLLHHFGGYTASAGNIWGQWRDMHGHESYGEHRLFTVAFSGTEGAELLDAFLAAVAAEIGEQTIYLQLGDEAWLVHAARTVSQDQHA